MFTMDGGDFAAIGICLLALVLIALLVHWWLKRVGKTPKGPRRELGCTPNAPVPFGSSYITDAYYYLMDQLALLEPTSQCGGVYANKPGYHNSRSQNSSSNYSVTDRPPDDGGPSTVAAAFDWTFPEAQRGDYSRISKYTQRLLASAKDPNDPRLDGWREFYGQANTDSYVEGWDTRYGYAVTSDSSHLWHIHLSESRDRATSRENKDASLSVLKGETVDQWRGVHAKGDGAVLLNCPYDEDRLDLLYVGPKGNVWHRWYPSGGMNALWMGNGSSENLGGVIVPGTLTASWAPDGSRINIAGVGESDEPACPVGCGNYWGMTLERGGKRSGWGSVTGAYGLLPTDEAQSS